MAKKAKGNMLANSKIISDKTYQDFNKQAPNLADPNQNKKLALDREPKIGSDGDVDAAPLVGARDKNAKNETPIKTLKK